MKTTYKLSEEEISAAINRYLRWLLKLDDKVNFKVRLNASAEHDQLDRATGGHVITAEAEQIEK